jgi:VanZ family protein
MRPERIALICAVAITAAALAGSLMPRMPMPPGPLGDKLLHAAGYATLAASWALALPRLPVRHPRLAIWVVVGLFGVAIEGLQALVPGRQASGFDALANAIGASAGLAALAVIGRVRSRGHSERPAQRSDA